MNFILILLAGIVGGGAQAATDFVHCKGFINARIDYRRLGISLGEDGKLIVKQNPTSGYNYSFRNGTHDFETAGGKSRILVETVGGRVKRIVETEYAGRPFSESAIDDNYQREIITFAEKNGVCYPSRKDEESIVPYASNSYSSFKKAKWDTKNSLEWHTEMCRDIHLFIKKNPKIKECRCGDDAANRGMEAILVKFDKNYGLEKFEARDDDVLTTLKTLGSPLAKAYKYLQNCEPVVGAIVDDRIWKRAGSTTADDSGQAKGANDAR